MDTSIENHEWDVLSYQEKNHQLFLKQMTMLDGLLAHGAISKIQHDLSARELISKMGEAN